MKNSQSTARKLFLVLPFLCLLVSACSVATGSPSIQILRISKEEGVLASDNGGGRWRNFSQGLPAGIEPLRITADSRGTCYLSTMTGGIYRRTKEADRWEQVSSPDFAARAVRNGNGHYRKVSAFAVDSENPETLTLATKHTLFISKNAGREWTRIPPQGLLPKYYFTALASSGSGATVFAGTSFGGVFRKNGAGGFQNRSRGMAQEPYSDTLSFIEEIGALHFSREAGCFAGANFSGELYRSRDNGESWTKLPSPFSGGGYTFISDMHAKDGALFIASSKGLYTMDLATNRWSPSPYDEIMTGVLRDHPADSFCVIDRTGVRPPLFCGPRTTTSSVQARPSRKALYTGVPAVRRDLQRLIDTIKATGMNALVIDVKDDFGNIYIPLENKTAREIGAAKTPLNIMEIIARLKAEGIWTIARIVTFKDRNLFRAYGFRYAIWNRSTNSAWQGNDKEFWVDPHSRFAQQYAIDIAKEAEAAGFDEIQFDYIRFPSDGPVGLCQYRYREDSDTYKSEVLVDFLRAAKQSLRVPVAVDLYGFTGWYRFGNLIGQDIEEFARTVDVICPMVYPSHYGTRFHRSLPREEHPGFIVYQSGGRAVHISGGRAEIRPYLQAFNLMSPTWGPGYIRTQVEAAEKSGCRGYIFWNAAANYDMVRRALPAAQR